VSFRRQQRRRARTAGCPINTVLGSVVGMRQTGGTSPGRPHASRLNFYAFALKVFYRKSGWPKIEEFQAFKTGRSLESKPNRTLSFAASQGASHRQTS
jgi:hypothetical protein